MSKNNLFFKKPKQNLPNIYKFKNLKITLRYINKINQIKKYKKNSTIAILDGSLKNKKGQKIISYGEIIKTETLQILLKTLNK